MPKAQHYQPNKLLSPFTNYNSFAILEDSDSSSERIRIKMAADTNKINSQEMPNEVAIATVAEATPTLQTTTHTSPTGFNRVVHPNRRAAACGLKPYRRTQQQERRMLKHAIQTLLTSRHQSLNVFKKMIAPNQAQSIIDKIGEEPTIPISTLKSWITKVAMSCHVNMDNNQKTTYSQQFMELFNKSEIINSDNDEKHQKTNTGDDDTTDIDDIPSPDAEKQEKHTPVSHNKEHNEDSSGITHPNSPYNPMEETQVQRSSTTTPSKIVGKTISLVTPQMRDKDTTANDSSDLNFNTNEAISHGNDITFTLDDETSLQQNVQATNHLPTLNIAAPDDILAQTQQLLLALDKEVEPEQPQQDIYQFGDRVEANLENALISTLNTVTSPTSLEKLRERAIIKNTIQEELHQIIQEGVLTNELTGTLQQIDMQHQALQTTLAKIQQQQQELEKQQTLLDQQHDTLKRTNEEITRSIIEQGQLYAQLDTQNKKLDQEYQRRKYQRNQEFTKILTNETVQFNNNLKIITTSALAKTEENYQTRLLQLNQQKEHEPLKPSCNSHALTS